MLTKLNNLRRKQRVIFILATNYAHRIDPAIRRKGRIDENYLLLPPDETVREEMLRAILSKEIQGKEPLFPKTIGEQELNALSKSALFRGYKDIEPGLPK